MCFHLPGPATSEHNIPTTVITQSPAQSHRRGHFSCEVNAISIQLFKDNWGPLCKFAHWNGILCRQRDMRPGDFWSLGPKNQKMEVVLLVKINPFQKRSSADMKAQPAWCSVFLVCTVERLWMSAYSKTQYIKWLSTPSSLRGWLRVW